MSDLAPYLRLIRLSDNQVVATTSAVLAYSWPSVLDQAPTLSVTVPLSDAGDASAGGDGFATAILAAGGGPGLPTVPVPLLLEFSLGGPDGPVDMRSTSFTPQRHPASGTLTLEIAGEDPYGAYCSTMPAGGGRTTFSDVAVQDVLGGAPGTIKPVDPVQQNRLLSPDGSIPALAGLLYHDEGTGAGLPGLLSWPLAARQRLGYTAVCSSTIAGAPTWLDSQEDTVSRAVAKVAQRCGGIVVPGDETSGVPQGSRGHLVIDPSDAALNLSQVVS